MRLLEFEQSDPERTSVFAECMEHYDVGSPDAEWPNNMMSRRAVVLACGVITKRDLSEPVYVDQVELELCKRLATEVAGIMVGVEVGMGSEATNHFAALYIPPASPDELRPGKIDEELVRRRFGGTLFPLATISVEPLAARGKWWEEVQENSGDFPVVSWFHRKFGLASWHAVIKWFEAQSAFEETAAVRIGDRDELDELDQSSFPAGTMIAPSVLPRMLIGLTKAGSFVGLFGVSVQT